MNVASLGIGWWSDVLADAIKRSGKLNIVSCFSRSPEKREAFAKKYGCRAARSYDEILRDRSIEAIINTTPNALHRAFSEIMAVNKGHLTSDKDLVNLKKNQELWDKFWKEKVAGR